MAIKKVIRISFGVDMNWAQRIVLLLVCVNAANSHITYGQASNSVGTLNRETRLRFEKLVPEIGNPDHFWSKLTVEQRLILKKSGDKGFNDTEFKNEVRQWYPKVMPIAARVRLYALEKWQRLRNRFSLWKQSNYKLFPDRIVYARALFSIPLSPGARALLPTLHDMYEEGIVSERGSWVHMPIDYYILKAVVASANRISTRLHEMTDETMKRHGIEKRYTPDDIPAQVRDIVRKEVDDLDLLILAVDPQRKASDNYKAYIKAADYLRADYLVDQAVCLWRKIVDKNQILLDEFQTAQELPPDLRKKYINKYLVVQEDFSIADVIVSKSRGDTYTWGDAMIYNSLISSVHEMNLDAINNSLKLNFSDILDKGKELTSLIGFEFLDTQRALQIKELKIINTGSINSIKPTTFLGLTNLETLELNGLDIKAIETGAFEGLTKLKILHLNRNQLVTLTSDMFKGVSQLDFLYVSYNHIAKIQENISTYLPHIKRLFLEGNKLTFIARTIFSNHAKLEHLNLSFNSIEGLETKAFSHMPSIETVNLENNKLLTIPEDLFEGSNSSNNIRVALTRNSRLIRENREALLEAFNRNRLPANRIIFDT